MQKPIPSAKTEEHIVGNQRYIGANPQYANVAPMYMPPRWVKVAKGVPFRRAGPASIPAA